MSDTDNNKKEIVQPVSVTPDHGGDSSSPDQSSNPSFLTTLFWSGLIILLLLALYVLFLLPRSVNQPAPIETDFDVQKPENVETVKPAAAPPLVPEKNELQETPALDEEENQQSKSLAEKLLTQLIELESLLERHSVKKWAAEEFAKGIARGQVGDEQFRQRNYSAAAKTFQLAIDDFQKLEEKIQPTLERALSRGEQALSQGNKLAAIQQFELALAIDEQNIRATEGLQRATTIEQLFALLGRGNSFESHSQLQQAKLIYQEAVELDPLSSEAKMALSRVEAKLIDEEFNHTIARGYEALQNQQYADARAAFKAAKKIKSRSKEPDIGLNKVAAAVRNEKISNLLFEGEHFRQLQQWQQAATTYQKIVQLDKHHQTAIQMLEDSSNKAKLVYQLKTAIEAANQLHLSKTLGEAEALLENVDNQPAPGSIIKGYAEELRTLVRVASTPIPIVLESDENTNVTVYKVARLGTFKRRELQLRPGPYTIVGSRAGYRDVRKKIQVSADSKNQIIVIHCNKPI